MRILVDMDGVLADWEAKFLSTWRERHPEKHYVPIEERSSFYVTENYPREWREIVRSIYVAPGFYRTLEPIEGGVEAIREMLELGHEVFVCTSPLSDYRNCVLEKYEWVEQFLGDDWIPRLILTKDKTLVKGDILIDDNPRPRGAETPDWEHVIYDQPYNRSITHLRRITWANWREVIHE